MKKLLLSLALGLGILTAGSFLSLGSHAAPATSQGQQPSASAEAPPAASAAAPAAPPASATAAVAAASDEAAPLPQLSPVPVPNKGDTAWMMVSTLLVILMTVPGLALFYGGLVRSKNMLSVLMQVMVTFSMIVVLWFIYGYSLAFHRRQRSSSAALTGCS
jgi:Amt family ammonium transporter